MEKLAHDLAEKIALHMQFDEDKKAVLAYGLTAIFQMVTLFTIVTFIGMVFHFWYESVIIFIGVGVIRKSTGGAHSNTMYGCILISALSITILSSLSRYILSFPVNVFINLGASVLVYILCLIVFYIRVPVDSPNKPIKKPEKIKRLRKQSFIIITLFFLISVAFVFLSVRYDRFYSITVSIRLTMLWQLFTLTKLGIRFFDKIDLQFKPVSD
ncbi:MAG: accessory gene regulator ArgB-like protein [Eubacteriales bacterium]